MASASCDEFLLQDGRRIYDMISTSFQSNFGHSHAGIREAMHRQLDTMAICSPKASFPLKQEVSERFEALFGMSGGRVFYTVSGSESVENALKMVRQISGRTKVLARQCSYHGASLGALSVAGDWRNLPHFTVDDQTVRIPEPADDPQLDRTKEIVAATGPDKIAALIVETISGTNGVVIPEQAWFDAIQTMCREHGIFLIVDEVLCGFGRCSDAFAFQDYGIQPDIVCTSKGITGGYVPFGAIWTGPEIARFYDTEKLTCGLTNYAHPLGLAALSAVLDVLDDEGFRQHKARLAEVFSESLAEIAKCDGVRAVRHRGLLAAIDLEHPAPSWETFFEHGMHVYSNGNLVVLAPPFVSSTERLQQELAKCRDLVSPSAALAAQHKAE